MGTTPLKYIHVDIYLNFFKVQCLFYFNLFLKYGKAHQVDQIFNELGFTGSIAYLELKNLGRLDK